MLFGLILYCHPSSWTYEIYIYIFIFYYSPCPTRNNTVKKCVLGCIGIPYITVKLTVVVSSFYFQTTNTCNNNIT